MTGTQSIEVVAVDRAATRLTTRTFVSTTVLLALGLVSIVVNPPGNDSVVNGTICLCLFGLAGVATARIHGRLSEGLASGMLMPWYAAVFTVTYGLTTLAWLEKPVGSQAIITPDSIRNAITLAAVGFASALFGYMAGATFASASVPRIGTWFTGRPAEPTLAGAWLLFLIWAGASAQSIRQGSVGYLANVSNVLSNPSPFAQALSLASSMGLLAVASAAWGHAKHRSFGWRIALALFVLFEGAFGLLSGTKESLIYLGLAVVLGRAAQRRKLPTTRVIIVFAVIIAIVVPLITAYRQVVNSNPGRLSVGQVLGNLSTIWNQTQQANSSQRGVYDTFLWRESRISDLGIIVQRTPSQIPFQSSSKIWEAPVVGMIPRAIWPSKPVLQSGLDFAHQYYQIPSTVYTSSASTPTGDLYMHGGYLVVIFGMLIVGFLMSVLDAAGAALRDPRWIFLVLTLFPIVLKQEIDYLSMAAALPYNLIAIGIAMRLARFGAPRTAPEAEARSVAHGERFALGAH